MANELNAVTTWTFYRETDLPEDVSEMFVQGEQAYAAYATVRDVAVFTNKRLIVRDAQGISGNKIEVYSLPWSSVDMWSSENAGVLDANSEIELWTRSGHYKINLKRDAEVRKIDQLIAFFVLN